MSCRVKIGEMHRIGLAGYFARTALRNASYLSRYCARVSRFPAESFPPKEFVPTMRTKTSQSLRLAMYSATETSVQALPPKPKFNASQFVISHVCQTYVSRGLVTP